MKKIFAVLAALVLTSPGLTAAYSVATPYWCGWGYSYSPCTNYSYAGVQYGYPYSYSYSYNYSAPYGTSCYPLSYDSYGRVTQTTCGYVGGAYPNYSYYQPYYPNYQYYHNNWHDYNHDHDYNWGGRDRDHDWNRR